MRGALYHALNSMQVVDMVAKAMVEGSQLFGFAPSPQMLRDTVQAPLEEIKALVVYRERS